MKKLALICIAFCFVSSFVCPDLTIMSYNIKNFWLRFDGQPGAIKTEGGDFQEKDAEKLNIIASLIREKKPDVIAILECASLGELFAFNRLFLEGNYRCWSFRAVDSRLSGIPLGLMVRKPVQVHSIELFDHKTFSQRGIIIAELSKGNYKFTLIAVHFKSKLETDKQPKGSSAVKRDKQCTKLREVIKQKLTGNPVANIIICGDFNDPPGRDDQEKAAGVPDMIKKMGKPVILKEGSKIKLLNATLANKDVDENGDLWSEKSKIDGKMHKILFDYFFLSAGAGDELKGLDYIYPEEFKGIEKASDHIPILLFLKKENREK
jgi:endonuclease/exonuclease/phosphatase family metal-dependent hydrolase